MKSGSSSVIKLPSIESSCGNATNDIEKELLRPNSLKLEAFMVGMAWAFACAICMLIVLSVLLVVAGYIGSIFPLD
jgi:hypothetical protein